MQKGRGEPVPKIREGIGGFGDLCDCIIVRIGMQITMFGGDGTWAVWHLGSWFHFA